MTRLPPLPSSQLRSPSVRRPGRLGALVLGGVVATGCAAQKGHAPVNGVDLYYEVHGAAGSSGTPLVLLHGGGSTFETSFAEILPALSRGRQVIVYDRQGHGRTPDVDRPFSSSSPPRTPSASSARSACRAPTSWASATAARSPCRSR